MKLTVEASYLNAKSVARSFHAASGCAKANNNYRLEAIDFRFSDSYYQSLQAFVSSCKLQTPFPLLYSSTPSSHPDSITAANSLLASHRCGWVPGSGPAFCRTHLWVQFTNFPMPQINAGCALLAPSNRGYHTKSSLWSGGL